MDYDINQPCSHYARGCLIQAPCCKIFYPCRLCHNEQYKGPKGPGCTIETMDRYAISVIKCLKCQLEQSPSGVCSNEDCKHILGKYFCNICKLFNNDTARQMYHCDICKMCRIGRAEDNFHCDVCDVCMPKSLLNNHKCLENKTESNCPVCLENLKTSTSFWFQLEKCGHCIHEQCYNDYIEQSDNPNCPACGTSLYEQSEEEKKQMEQYIQEAEANMDEELKKAIEGKKANILCNECGLKTQDLPFNIIAHKCSHCGCYNTKVI